MQMPLVMNQGNSNNYHYGAVPNPSQITCYNAKMQVILL